METAMKSWVSQSSFVANNKQLISDAQHSATALRTPGETDDQLHLVCGVMDYESEEANAALPTPDSVASTLLSDAYGNLGAGATICYGAGTSSAKRARALAYLSKGVGQLNEAYARIMSDTSSTPG